MLTRKNHRGLYKTLNAVYGHKPKALHPVRDKRGELLSAPDQIKDGWVEHFNELLNRPTVVDFDILDDIEKLPIMEHFDNLITMEELNTAIKNKNKTKEKSRTRRFTAGDLRPWRK